MNHESRRLRARCLAASNRANCSSDAGTGVGGSAGDVGCAGTGCAGAAGSALTGGVAVGALMLPVSGATAACGVALGADPPESRVARRLAALSRVIVAACSGVVAPRWPSRVCRAATLAARSERRKVSRRNAISSGHRISANQRSGSPISRTEPTRCAHRDRLGGAGEFGDLGCDEACTGRAAHSPDAPDSLRAFQWRRTTADHRQ